MISSTDWWRPALDAMAANRVHASTNMTGAMGCRRSRRRARGRHLGRERPADPAWQLGAPRRGVLGLARSARRWPSRGRLRPRARSDGESHPQRRALLQRDAEHRRAWLDDRRAGARDVQVLAALRISVQDRHPGRSPVEVVLKSAPVSGVLAFADLAAGRLPLRSGHLDSRTPIAAWRIVQSTRQVLLYGAFTTKMLALARAWLRFGDSPRSAARSRGVARSAHRVLGSYRHLRLPAVLSRPRERATQISGGRRTPLSASRPRRWSRNLAIRPPAAAAAPRA